MGDLRVGDWIQTWSGIKMYPLDPREEEIFIEDIAIALSHQVRFSGHLTVPYTIAQHSVVVAEEMRERAPEHLKTTAYGLGLLHDAQEAYLIDVPRPLKRLPMFAEYRVIEDRLEQVVRQKYGFRKEETDQLEGLLKESDQRACAAETVFFQGVHPDFGCIPERVGELTPLAQGLLYDCWNHNTAYYRFQNAFRMWWYQQFLATRKPSFHISEEEFRSLNKSPNEIIEADLKKAAAEGRLTETQRQHLQKQPEFFAGYVIQPKKE